MSFITSRTRKSAPIGPVVTLQEMQEHLRLDLFGSPPSHPEDDLVMIKVQAATDEIDGADGWLGRALLPQQWQITTRGFPCSTPRNPDAVLWLPLPPLISVDSVRYRDSSGAYVTLAPNQYEVRAGNPVAGIAPLYLQSWPVTADADNAVEVTFTAGYDGDASPPNPLPAIVKQFVMVVASTMYEQREDLAININTAPVRQFRLALDGTLRVWGP